MSIWKYLREGLDDGPTEEEFFKKHDLNPDDVHYLGKGDFGEAYVVTNSEGKEAVLKKTTSKSEYEIAQRIMEKGDVPALKHIVNIFATEKVDGDYYILQEYLDEDSDIEDNFWTISNALDTQGLPLTFMGSFDPDEYGEQNGEPLDHEVLAFMDEIDDVVRAYHYLGIQRPDIQPDNLARNAEGTLVAFDIDESR